VTEAGNSLPPLDGLEVERRRVLVRADLNVPLENGAITDDLRVRASLPTLEALLARGARVAVCSHLGRPKGKVKEELRLAPVGKCMAELLQRDVDILDEVVGSQAERACASDAEVVLLENLRFEPGEEANDKDFSARLAGLAGAYVNDAFGSSHRAHASVVGVPALLPHAAGLLLAKEVAELERLLQDPDHPFVAVLGGAKVSDKLGVLTNLLQRVDQIVVGGAMAFTLLAARGQEVGRSRVERDRLDEIAKVLQAARDKDVEVYLPTDVVAAADPEPGSPHAACSLEDIGDRMGVDIGPETAARFAEVVSAARTVLWNGPMGIFEIDDYAAGTKAVAEAIAEATSAGAFTVAGGGDSAAALQELDMTEAVSHLSTGGGASLELLEGKELPGVAALRKESS
jgi:phosphoglycerate kinase